MPNHHYRRTDLFLVRVWTQDDDGSTGESEGNSDGSLQARCYGRVQRVVSGEAREFHDWQALLDALNAMLSSTRGATRIGKPERSNEP